MFFEETFLDFRFERFEVQINEVSEIFEVLQWAVHNRSWGRGSYL